MKYIWQEEQKEYNTGSTNIKRRKRSQRRNYTQNKEQVLNRDQKKQIADIVTHQIGTVITNGHSEN